MKMNKFVATIFFALITAKTCCSCPLDSIETTKNITEMTGKWHEYKKTTDFLTSNVCTTYAVTCPETDACNVNLLPNGTNTGYANTLIKTETSTMWGNNTIYLNTPKEFVLLWNCNEETKKYNLAVLMRDITDEATIKEIDALLKTLTVSFTSELEATDNTLCSSAEKSTIHRIVLIILIFKIFTNISRF